MVKTDMHHHDIINNTTLYNWVDCYFDNYVASSKFSIRVKINNHKL